jgi:hypothetical protein
MHHVVLTRDGCPNEALTWESGVSDDIGRLSPLARLYEPTTVVGAERDDCGWQISGGTNLVEARGILHRLTMFWRKLGDIRVTESPHRKRQK